MEQFNHQVQAYGRVVYLKFLGLPGIKKAEELGVFDALKEVFFFVMLLKVYNFVRNQYGSRIVAVDVAKTHADEVVAIEKFLNVFVEEKIQAAFLNNVFFIKLMNTFYYTAHPLVTIIGAVLLYMYNRSNFPKWRNVFLIMNFIALFGYAVWPLMPPRLLGDCETEYGGCDRQYFFVDTLEGYGAQWSWRSGSASVLSNQYAAMPSMHIGYALWSTNASLSVVQNRIGRLTFMAYPFIVALCIVVTANHFILDMVGGLITFFMGHILTFKLYEVFRGKRPNYSKLKEDVDIEEGLCCASTNGETTSMS
eukprot:Clim_evm105s210 gene=Clim_evmTU105s210